MFRDRRDAGRQLLGQLPHLDPKSTVVIALPRGGVPAAEEIAHALHLPLDVVLVRKVGLPGQPEVAVAAVTDGGNPVFAINRQIADMAGLSDADIRALALPQMAEIERRRGLWRGDRPDLRLVGKTVVVVDDGIATGATMKAALDTLRRAGAARLILAVPVAAADALADLLRFVDEAICLSVPHPFRAVGAHYQDFRQITDAEVAKALQAVSAKPMAGRVTHKSFGQSP
ncbi:phosphoribosyltransferase [Roseicyclus marinus]|uniref:phosphoribosyltransferase n=1 Tax=Roseicyclus marinus TaxID=2161673 RepID=UPI0030C6B663